MWSRAGVKERSKKMMSQNYAKMLIVGIILVISEASFNNIRSLESFIDELFVKHTYGYVELDAQIALIALGLVMIGFFVLNPLSVGVWKYYIDLNRDGHSDFSKLKFGFERDNYKSIVKSLFRRDLYLIFWGLFLIASKVIASSLTNAYIIEASYGILINIVFGIPFTILLWSKILEYMLVPLILVDKPNIENSEPVRLSSKLMNRNKWNVFVYYLSFIGWSILIGMVILFLIVTIRNSVALILSLPLLTLLIPYINGGIAEIYEILIEYSDFDFKSKKKDAI